MTRAVRVAMTETCNQFAPMPASVAELGTLAHRLDELREANLAHHVRLIRQAKAYGVQILGMGELFPAPYFALDELPMWRDLAESADDGPSVQTMQTTARELQMILIAPIYELDRTTGKRFNTAVVIDEHGSILGKYRKTHIPNGENEQGRFAEGFYYERSDGKNGSGAANISKNPFFPVFETSIGRVGVAICYDRHFDYVMPALARSGAELVFCPAVTFGDKSQRMWHMEFPVDAARHNLFIAGSNRRGSEPPWNQSYFGESYFVGPNGEPTTKRDCEGLVWADLPLHELGGPDPSGWNLPRDHRPDIAE